jgi:hypothetical protein
MKGVMNKRKWFIVLVMLTFGLCLASVVFAAPVRDGAAPTLTPTPTVTSTSPPPTAQPPPTDTPVPNLVEPTQAEQIPTEDPQATNTPEISTALDQNSGLAAAGSSVLGFLLCAGVIIVAGLAALNIWARRNP